MKALSCSNAEAAFIDVVDGRLEPAASVRLHAHIESCAACRERAALWRGLVPALRALSPEPPEAMASRRMQIEVERQLAAQTGAPPRTPWRWVWAPAALGLIASVAAVVVWTRGTEHRPIAAQIEYATVSRLRGALTVGGRLLGPTMAVPIGSALTLADGAETELALPRGTTLRITGPAHLAFAGTAAAVAVRLDDGRVVAAVAHRLPGETFAVLTRDLRVDVRGTKFSVVVGTPGSEVRVDEGQVAVSFVDGRSRLVSAGEGTSSFAPADAPPPVETEPTPGSAPPRAAPAPTCPGAARACQETTQLVRSGMRSGDPARALRMLTERGRATFELDARCGGAVVAACQDELRYLRAEALDQAGRLDDAVSAYRALNRRGAPPMMRQNALYAAAQIERRRGRNADARTDYELALGAAPRGALREEALVGAMETAEASGDLGRAAELGRRYLNEFPTGLGAPAARRLMGAAPLR